jgi:cytoskeletal protein CcmA (bactofilin family)
MYSPKESGSLIQDIRQSFDSLLPAKQGGTPTPAPRVPGGPPTRSIVDSCLVITGNLESERDVQVDGAINGDVNCSQLVVSKDATITGNVTAEEVVIRGKVKGVIRAAQVVLQDTAHVESDIFHKSLIIEQGAHFDGQSHRLEQATTSAKSGKTAKAAKTRDESERAA